MQAQEFVPAKWAVARRARATESAVDGAFADGTILRTHVLRPTWHFVTPEDIPWLLALTGPRVHRLNAYYYRKFGLDADAFALSRSVFLGALAGGHRTRAELAELLAAAGLPASGLHLGYLLMRAELDGVLISGAPRGRQQTYARYEERVPAAAPVDREAALAELTRRYLTTRGPATTKDFASWSSLTVADATRGVALNPGLVSETVAGRTYWSFPGTERAAAGPVVDLIQGYDEYVMSYGETKDLLAVGGVAPAHLHTILLDGRVIGSWRHTAKARSATVETSFDRPLTERERAAVDVAVADLGRFLERPTTWR